ncbi:MAG: hypothetical protein MJ061_04030 [Mailhella sp.]|nr:hypothetical protein [Mailhella sp.]
MFTVNDTFRSLRLRADRGRVDTFLRLLPSLEGLSDGGRRLLSDAGSPVRRMLDEQLAEAVSLGGFDITWVKRAFEKLPFNENGNGNGSYEQDNLLLQTLFLKIFRDPEASGKNLATYENLESLIPQMDDQDVMKLIDAYSKRGGMTSKLESNYIEGHIHGGFSLGHDVKEITVDRVQTTGTDQEIAYMDAVMDVFNGRKIPRARLEQLSEEQKTRLDGLKARLGGRTIPMRWTDSDQDFDNEAPVKASEDLFMTQHFSFRKLNGIIGSVQSDEGFRNWIAKSARFELGAISRLFSYGTFPPAADIGDLRRRFVERCAELELHPEQLEVYAEPENVALKRALADVYGAERLEAARLLGRQVGEQLNGSQGVYENPESMRLAAAFAERILHGEAAVTENLPRTLSAAMAFSDALTAIAEGDDISIESLMARLGKMPGNWFSDAAAAEGFRTALAGLEGPRRTSVLQRLEAHRAELAGIEAAFARLGGPQRGLAAAPHADGMKTCALAMHHLLAWADAQSGREAARPGRFEGDLSQLDATQRQAVAAAFPSVGETLASGYPPIPVFPAPALPELLPSGREQERDFLKQMLPVYQSHESEDGYDRNTGYHGRGHICRAFILASAMASIMEERGVPVNRGILLCGITGHDSGRTKNGSDTQEAASAERTIEHIGIYANGGLRGEVDPLGPQAAGELRRCIVGHQSTTIEGILLNSADSLDIGRVQDYDFRYLSFLKGASSTGDPVDIPDDERLRKGLQAEAMLLAKLTDPIVANRMKLTSYDMEMDELDELYRQGRIDGATKQAEEERLQNEKEMFRDSMYESMRILQDIPDQEEFISYIEGPIKANPQLFPLLSRYYLHMPQQPMPDGVR